MSELSDLVARSPQIRFHVVVPLAAGGNLTAARERLELQLGLIGDLGVAASGEIGDADPLAAVELALAHEPAEGIILSTLAPGVSRWHKANVPGGLDRRIDVPFVIVYDDEAEHST
jgi:hypothetical protein